MKKYTYIIKWNGAKNLYKIGCSENPKKRLKNIQSELKTCYPFSTGTDVELLYVTKNKDKLGTWGVYGDGR